MYVTQPRLRNIWNEYTLSNYNVKISQESVSMNIKVLLYACYYMHVTTFIHTVYTCNISVKQWYSVYNVYHSYYGIIYKFTYMYTVHVDSYMYMSLKHHHTVQ